MKVKYKYIWKEHTFINDNKTKIRIEEWQIFEIDEKFAKSFSRNSFVKIEVADQEKIKNEISILNWEISREEHNCKMNIKQETELFNTRKQEIEESFWKTIKAKKERIKELENRIIEADVVEDTEADIVIGNTVDTEEAIGTNDVWEIATEIIEEEVIETVETIEEISEDKPTEIDLSKKSKTK